MSYKDLIWIVVCISIILFTQFTEVGAGIEKQVSEYLFGEWE